MAGWEATYDYDIIWNRSVALIAHIFIQWRQRGKPLKIGCFLAQVLDWLILLSFSILLYVYFLVEFVYPFDAVDCHVYKIVLVF